MAFYIDAGKNGSSGEIAYLLKKCILHCPKKWTEIVFLCIGSDRVTGDCLGPYIILMKPDIFLSTALFPARSMP